MRRLAGREAFLSQPRLGQAIIFAQTRRECLLRGERISQCRWMPFGMYACAYLLRGRYYIKARLLRVGIRHAGVARCNYIIQAARPDAVGFAAARVLRGIYAARCRGNFGSDCSADLRRSREADFLRVGAGLKFPAPHEQRVVVAPFARRNEDYFFLVVWQF